MSAQYVLCGHMSVSVCTEQTVLLVPLILLVIVNVLVDTSAQIKLTKGPERGQIELSKLLSQHFCCSNNCISMDGQDGTMGGQYDGRFKRRKLTITTDPHKHTDIIYVHAYLFSLSMVHFKFCVELHFKYMKDNYV